MGLKHSPCFGPLYDDKLCKECIIKEECRRKMLRKDFSQMTIEEVKKFSNCFGEMFSESSALCNKCLKRKECKVVFEYLKGGGKMDEDTLKRTMRLLNDK